MPPTSSLSPVQKCLAETAAHALGVQDVIALARASADAIEARSKRPLAEGFAVEALRALADEAERLIKTAPREQMR